MSKRREETAKNQTTASAFGGTDGRSAIAHLGLESGLLGRKHAHVAARGFHVHTAVGGAEDDRAFATRLARYCARSPVALERQTYDRAAKAVTDRPDKSEGPTAGTSRPSTH